MERKTAYALVLSLLLTTVLVIWLSNEPVAEASPLTTLSVDPEYIDPALFPVGSVFSINITVADVENLWGFEIVLRYETGVLSATSLGFYPPFQHIVVSYINDAEGYVSLLAGTYIGDTEGFSTVDPAPMASVEFLVDTEGTSPLWFEVSKLSTPFGTPIQHIAIGGSFGGGPVPEFELGYAFEILFIPAIFYTLWRSKQRKKVTS